jgi:hypothetical protein
MRTNLLFHYSKGKHHNLQALSVLHGAVCINFNDGHRCKRRENRKSKDSTKVTKEITNKFKLMFMLLDAQTYINFFNKNLTKSTLTN